MTSGPTPITTLLLVKPRALKRHFPKILKKIMYEGYQVVGFHLGMLNKEKIDSLLEADMQVRKLNKLTSDTRFWYLGQNFLLVDLQDFFRFWVLETKKKGLKKSSEKKKKLWKKIK